MSIGRRKKMRTKRRIKKAIVKNLIKALDIIILYLPTYLVIVLLINIYKEDIEALQNIFMGGMFVITLLIPKALYILED
jgi:magnesium-transporting ATPase (P-type)